MLAETNSDSGTDTVIDTEPVTKEHLFDNCEACKAKRQQAHSSNLPAVVVNGTFLLAFSLVSLPLFIQSNYVFVSFVVCGFKQL